MKIHKPKLYFAGAKCFSNSSNLRLGFCLFNLFEIRLQKTFSALYLQPNLITIPYQRYSGNLKSDPYVHSDAYFVINGLLQIKCRYDFRYRHIF